MVEGVDACLHKEIGHGENCVLQGAGDADVQDASGLVAGNVKMLRAEAEILPDMEQQAEDQNGGQVLGEDAGNGHSFYIQMADDHKKQIQKHIDNPGEAQIIQRPSGVTGGAQHRVAEIVQCQGRHTQQIDAQIDHSIPDQLVLGVHEGENAIGKSDAEYGDGSAGSQTEDDGGMYSLPQVVSVPGADVEGCHGVDAAGQTDEYTREERDQDAGGAHCAQSYGAGKFAHHRHVRQIKHHL